MASSGTTLRALLPTGDVWPRSVPDLTRDQVLDALGVTFDRVRGLAAQLIEESDPRTAVALLPEWERAVGLPDACDALADTIAERQRRAHAKLIRKGGWSRDYFTRIAAALGYQITLVEHTPATCISDCTAALDPDDLTVDGWPRPWPFVLDIHAPATTTGELDCRAGGCDEPLRWWNNDYLACVLRREFRRSLPTRHLYVRFFFGD